MDWPLSTPRKMPWNFGTTKTISAATIATATMMMMTGYVMADPIRPLMRPVFSVNTVWRSSTKARTPPTSPALTMLT